MGHQCHTQQEPCAELYRDTFENEEAGSEAWVIKHGDTPIAFSPDFILNNRFGYTFKGFEASLQSQYISKQYMSNAKQEECTLDAYFVSNLNLSYTFKLPKVKSVTVGCTIYNLFNEEYETTDTQAADTITTTTEEKSVTTMPATLPRRERMYWDI